MPLHKDAEGRGRRGRGVYIDRRIFKLRLGSPIQNRLPGLRLWLVDTEPCFLRTYSDGPPLKSSINDSEPPWYSDIQHYSRHCLSGSLFDYPPCGKLETTQNKAREAQRGRRKESWRLYSLNLSSGKGTNVAALASWSLGTLARSTNYNVAFA